MTAPPIVPNMSCDTRNGVCMYCICTYLRGQDTDCSSRSVMIRLSTAIVHAKWFLFYSYLESELECDNNGKNDLLLAGGCDGENHSQTF